MWIADKIYYQGSSAFTRAYQGDELVWINNYLTPMYMTAQAANTTIKLGLKSSYQTVEYSTDGGNVWNNMTTTTTINLASGDTVYFRGILTAANSTSRYTQFKFTGKVKIGGNINYFWNKDNPDAALKNYCGYGLFSGCTALTDVTELELPATTLASHCYESMFYGCTSLTTAPELPATASTDNCYMSMFGGCTSLTTAPSILPATTLASECYREMFYNCSSLVTAPALPATALTNYCYAYMFYGCTSLTTAPELPATTLAESCYGHMFVACYGLTTPPALPATTLANSCYSHMFYACTSLATAPSILPATTLVDYCYYGMFKACYSLNYIKCLATDISASGCTSGWVDSVSGTGTFVKDENMTGWTRGVDGIPTGWTVENT